MDRNVIGKWNDTYTAIQNKIGELDQFTDFLALYTRRGSNPGHPD